MNHDLINRLHNLFESDEPLVNDIESQTDELKEEETQAGNDLDEIAAMVYTEASNDVDDIPDYDYVNDNIASVTRSEYNKIYNNVKTAMSNVDGHFYNGMIELSDRATINQLTNDKRDIEEWGYIVERKLRQFEDETTVGVWQDGRMGRHIVVEDDYYNARDYHKLCDILERLEQEAIDEFNGENINESEASDEIAVAIEKFNNSAKTLADYSKFLNLISQLEWDNKISRAEYEEYVKQAQKILSSREVVKESIESEEEFNDAVATVAEYNKYLDSNSDDTDVLDKTMKLIRQIDAYLAINDPDSFILPYDIPAPVLNGSYNPLEGKCPYCTTPVTKGELETFGMCQDCYDNGVE